MLKSDTISRLTCYILDLLQKSFSSNFWAGGTPTPQEKMTLVGWAEKPVLVYQLGTLLFGRMERTSQSNS
jgi:hypothetical protein